MPARQTYKCPVVIVSIPLARRQAISVARLPAGDRVDVWTAPRIGHNPVGSHQSPTGVLAS